MNRYGTATIIIDAIILVSERDDHEKPDRRESERRIRSWTCAVKVRIEVAIMKGALWMWKLLEQD